MVRVVDVFSVIPYATITGRFSFFEMLGGYGFLVLCLIYMKIREPKVLLAALTLLLIISVKILIELFLIAGN
jgi:competence protein ComEC